MSEAAAGPGPGQAEADGAGGWPPCVLVLVGTSGTGKTTLRRALLGAGFPADHVLSLDDLRREERATDLARGVPPRPLQDYSFRAVRRARRRADALAGFGVGYLADATHLRRRERREHLRTAQDAGLPAVAVLTPLVDEEELLARDARRPPDDRVPEDVLRRQRHRRSLLSADMLREEGFAVVFRPSG